MKKLAQAGIELRVLHLVRDSRAVAYSWLRRKRMPEVTSEERYMPLKRPWRSAVFWSLENLALELLRPYGAPTSDAAGEAAGAVVAALLAAGYPVIAASPDGASPRLAATGGPGDATSEMTGAPVHTTR